MDLQHCVLSTKLDLHNSSINKNRGASGKDTANKSSTISVGV